MQVCQCMQQLVQQEAQVPVAPQHSRTVPQERHSISRYVVRKDANTATTVVADISTAAAWACILKLAAAAAAAADAVGMQDGLYVGVDSPAWPRSPKLLLLEGPCPMRWPCSLGAPVLAICLLCWCHTVQLHTAVLHAVSSQRMHSCNPCQHSSCCRRQLLLVLSSCSSMQAVLCILHQLLLVFLHVLQAAAACAVVYGLSACCCSSRSCPLALLKLMKIQLQFWIHPAVGLLPATATPRSAVAAAVTAGERAGMLLLLCCQPGISNTASTCLLS
jgi:hypothetical protein